MLDSGSTRNSKHSGVRLGIRNIPVFDSESNIPVFDSESNIPVFDSESNIPVFDSESESLLGRKSLADRAGLGVLWGE